MLTGHEFQVLQTAESEERMPAKSKDVYEETYMVS